MKAFVGGIDLTVGRWDTGTHQITDNNRLAPRWPGKVNSSLFDEYNCN